MAEQLTAEVTSFSLQSGGASMANDEHVALLKQGVDAWNKWREKNRSLMRRNDEPRDLRGADLTGADLHRVDLGRAYLSAANLSNTNLRGTAQCHVRGFSSAGRCRQSVFL